MKLGVPLVPLVMLFGTTMLAIIWIGPLFSWWVIPVATVLAAPAFAWMRLVTRKDDQRFRQVFLLLKVHIGHRNAGFWNARTYSPYLYRGARHAYRR